MINNRLFDGILVFVQVVKHGSFSAAAQTMGHSSAHLSKELSRLEDRLGVRLLNRTTRSIALTPDGQAYYERCLDLVQDAESAYSLVTQTNEMPKGRLKISCPIGIGHSHIQPVVSEYLQRYPNVSLDWNVSDQREDLIADGYDLAIRAAPSLNESSLICKRIYSCPAYIVASPSFIEKYGRPYHPKELEQFNCICYSNLSAPGRWEFKEASGKTFTVDVKQYIRCNNGDMEVQMVKAGAGICHRTQIATQPGSRRLGD